MKLELVWHDITFFLGSRFGIDHLYFSRIGGCMNIYGIREKKNDDRFWDPREYEQKKL